MILYPLQEKFRVSQKFGESFNGYYKQFGFDGHDGVDFATPVGTPIVATHDGVVRIGNQGDKCYGKYIKLTSSTRQSLYAHLSDFNVKDGQTVNQGDIIGYTGNSGGSTGAHLHWSFRSLENGKTKNFDNGYHGRIDVLGMGLVFLGKKVGY